MRSPYPHLPKPIRAAWCPEVNTPPGMTPASLIPKAAKPAGMDCPALRERTVPASLKKAG